LIIGSPLNEEIYNAGKLSVARRERAGNLFAPSSLSRPLLPQSGDLCGLSKINLFLLTAPFPMIV